MRVELWAIYERGTGRVLVMLGYILKHECRGPNDLVANLDIPCFKAISQSFSCLRDARHHR
jgi:hypothetical protein